MSDLISRSELLTRIRLNYNNHQNISAGAIKDIIDTMPAAYSVDKVVKELETKENEAILKAPNTSDFQNPDYQKWMMKSYGFKEAIEIVKQGRC